MTGGVEVRQANALEHLHVRATDEVELRAVGVCRTGEPFEDEGDRHHGLALDPMAVEVGIGYSVDEDFMHGHFVATFGEQRLGAGLSAKADS